MPITGNMHQTVIETQISQLLIGHRSGFRGTGYESSRGLECNCKDSAGTVGDAKGAARAGIDWESSDMEY
jgi:hypothetical protein